MMGLLVLEGGGRQSSHPNASRQVPPCPSETGLQGEEKITLTVGEFLRELNAFHSMCHPVCPDTREQATETSSGQCKQNRHSLKGY